MYSGIYNGTKKHEPDLQQVLQRSWDAGLSKIVITGGNLEESIKALEICRSDDRLYATVGCHPTRCGEFEQNGQDPNNYLEKLSDLISQGKSKVVAVGECGLDYDRVQFCDKDVQKRYFELQLKLSEKFDLPLFLHCRNAADDLYSILSRYPNLKGVVHSFDGTEKEAKMFIDLGFYIGLNGCSLKTEENLKTVQSLPSDKILLETDCPWCEVRPSHAGYKLISKENQAVPSVKKEKWSPHHMVKSRNEPNNIRQVFDIVSTIKQVSADEFCEKIYQNTLDLFLFDNKSNLS
ncbi:deoxyribonuclease TATDN1 isoform X2 [Leptinotarsa decemlineata]